MCSLAMQINCKFEMFVFVSPLRTIDDAYFMNIIFCFLCGACACVCDVEHAERGWALQRDAISHSRCHTHRLQRMSNKSVLADNLEEQNICCFPVILQPNSSTYFSDMPNAYSLVVQNLFLAARDTLKSLCPLWVLLRIVAL